MNTNEVITNRAVAKRWPARHRPRACRHLRIPRRAQHRLRCFEPFPAWKVGREIYFAPFDVAWRLLEIGDLREEGLYEPLDPLVVDLTTAVDDGVD